MQFDCQLHGLVTVIGFRDTFEITASFQQGAQPFAHDPMVIGDESALDFWWSQGAFSFNHFNRTVKQTSYRSLV
jgi:hypothetical protein